MSNSDRLSDKIRLLQIGDSIVVHAKYLHKPFCGQRYNLMRSWPRDYRGTKKDVTCKKCLAVLKL